MIVFMRKIWFVLVILVLIIFIFLIIEGSNKNNDNDSSSSGNGNIFGGELKGFALSPKSFSGSDFPAFFAKAKEGGDAITGWAEIEQIGGQNSLPNVVAGLAEQYDYEPMLMTPLNTKMS